MMVDGGFQNGTEKVIIIKNAKYNAELDGEFDEEKNQKEFMEALDAVRGKTMIAKPKEVKLGKKFSCYNCFKLVPEDSIIKFIDKHVCSEDCKKVVEKTLMSVCESCNQTCLKSNLYFLNGHLVCSEECRKDMGVEELNMQTLDFDEEIKKSSEVIAKSQELNHELSRLKRMQEEIDYLKTKHDNIKVDMNIDTSKFNID